MPDDLTFVVDAVCAAVNAAECAEVVHHAVIFASETGFDVIFDSSKDLPTELRDLACRDVTIDFIDRCDRQAAKAQD